MVANRDVRWSADGQPLEAALTEGLHHPGIVETIAHSVTGCTTSLSSSPDDSEGETWLLLEYCDGGCLQVWASYRFRQIPARRLQLATNRCDLTITLGLDWSG